jgi:hypothetical protein
VGCRSSTNICCGFCLRRCSLSGMLLRAVFMSYALAARRDPADIAPARVVDRRRALAIGRRPADDVASRVVQGALLCRRCGGRHRDGQQGEQHLGHGVGRPDDRSRAQRASLVRYSGLAAALQRFLHLDLRNTEQAIAMDRFTLESPTSRCWGPTGDVRWVWQVGVSRIRIELSASGRSLLACWKSYRLSVRVWLQSAR